MAPGFGSNWISMEHVIYDEWWVFLKQSILVVFNIGDSVKTERIAKDLFTEGCTYEVE